MTVLKLPFYRRLWFWVIVAPPLLLAVVWFASLFLGVWAKESVTVDFTRVTGTPDGPIYNMTEQEAARLPGHLPDVLNRAGQIGSATAKFSSHADFEKMVQAIHHSRYIRYHGTVLEMGLARAIG